MRTPNQPQGPRSQRLGQTTIGKNRDLRIDMRVDGMFEFLEVLIPNTDIATKPRFDSKLMMNHDGLIRASNLINQILDNLEKQGESPEPPINDSDYMQRRPIDGEKGKEC